MQLIPICLQMFGLLRTSWINIKYNKFPYHQLTVAENTSGMIFIHNPFLSFFLWKQKDKMMNCKEKKFKGLKGINYLYWTVFSTFPRFPWLSNITQYCEK